MDLVYVIKVKSKQDLLDGGFGMARDLINKHPHWCDNYRAVYRSKGTGIEFVERDRKFICYDYIWDEKLSLDEALNVCAEVLI